MRRAILSFGAVVLACCWCAGQEQPGPAKAAVNLSPLTHEIELDVPVARVWDVFTTDEGYKNFGVAKAKIDCKVGGKMQSHYSPTGELGDEGTIEQTILAFEPQRMIAFRITKPPKGFPYMNAYNDMWSVATMSDLGQGRTRLRLTQVGYTAAEESQKMRAFFDQGNLYALTKLKERLSGAAPAQAQPTIATDDPLAPLVAETTVNAMPGDVWKNWTTGEGVKAFLGVENKVELRIGGPYEFYFGPTQPEGARGSEGCTILSYDPERMLSFSWNAPPTLPHARSKRTWVVVSIAPHGGHGSKVTLKHYGFTEQAAANPEHAEEWKQCRAYFKNAWPSVLQKLSDHYKQKTPTAAPK
jgi:uncharacterized protein YndB with AHSA1/START domain